MSSNSTQSPPPSSSSSTAPFPPSSTSSAFNLGKLQAELECCICMCLYEEPKQLPCGHICCGPCVQSLIDMANEPAVVGILFQGQSPHKTIACPQCRKECQVPADGSFPTAFIVQNLVSHVKEVGIQSLALANTKASMIGGNCSACDKYVLSEDMFYCITCHCQNFDFEQLEPNFRIMKNLLCSLCGCRLHTGHKLVPANTAYEAAVVAVEELDERASRLYDLYIRPYQDQICREKKPARKKTKKKKKTAGSSTTIPPESHILICTLCVNDSNKKAKQCETDCCHTAFHSACIVNWHQYNGDECPGCQGVLQFNCCGHHHSKRTACSCPCAVCQPPLHSGYCCQCKLSVNTKGVLLRLKCGHHYCEECFQDLFIKMVEEKMDEDGSLQCEVCKKTSQYRLDEEFPVVQATKMDQSSSSSVLGAAIANEHGPSTSSSANLDGQQCKWCGEGPAEHNPLQNFCFAGCLLHPECWHELYTLSGMCFCEEVVNQAVFVETNGLMTMEKGMSNVDIQCSDEPCSSSVESAKASTSSTSKANPKSKAQKKAEKRKAANLAKEKASQKCVSCKKAMSGDECYSASCSCSYHEKCYKEWLQVINICPGCFADL